MKRSDSKSLAQQATIPHMFLSPLNISFTFQVLLQPITDKREVPHAPIPKNKILENKLH